MSTLCELIENRYSPLAFSSSTIEDDKVELLFKAAQWAPSSFNAQPWRFVYVKRENEDSFNRMLNCLVEPNKEWAENAGMLVLIVSKKTFSHNGSVNNHAQYDTGAAVNNICIQATELGLYVRQMAGFYKDKVQEEYKLPEDFESIAVMAVGYLGENKDLSEGLQKRSETPRTRVDLNEICNENSWFK